MHMLCMSFFIRILSFHGSCLETIIIKWNLLLCGLLMHGIFSKVFEHIFGKNIESKCDCEEKQRMSGVSI